MARIVDAIGRVRSGGLSCVEAAALLGMSDRHFRRLRDAYSEGGAAAIIDRRRGRPASNRAPPGVADWVVAQFTATYFDFTPKHFHEALAKAYNVSTANADNDQVVNIPPLHTVSADLRSAEGALPLKAWLEQSRLGWPAGQRSRAEPDAS